VGERVFTGLVMDVFVRELVGGEVVEKEEAGLGRGGRVR
jgi:hypothetical protein